MSKPRAILVVLLLGLSAADLGSESVTLTTYYPAPFGAYAKMITTGDAYLARDGGGVGIGTVTPEAKLHVRGDVIIEGNLLLTGRVAGYRPSAGATASASATAVPVPAGVSAGAAARPPAASEIRGLCQELLGVPAPNLMTCGRKTVAIPPAACEPVEGQKRCACPQGYELVALGISMPVAMTAIPPENRTARGLEALFNAAIPVPVVTYGCLAK